MTYPYHVYKDRHPTNLALVTDRQGEATTGQRLSNERSLVHLQYLPIGKRNNIQNLKIGHSITY